MTELIITIGILQLLIPLILLFWQWREHSTDKILWLFKTIFVISYLSVIAIAGLWNLLPFFVPYLYLSMSLVLAVRGFIKIRETPFWQTRKIQEKLKLSFIALLGVFSFLLGIYCLLGWRVPLSDVVHLNFPLKGGTFYIANGGSNFLLNPHFETLEGENHRPWRGQSYATDILQINGYGLRANGALPANPKEYVIFGSPVYAPCAGKIIETENEREDLMPPQSDQIYLAGNHVLVDCGEFNVLLAHFKKGSVQVTTGQSVEVGQMLGQVGNSGSTGEPHLHIHAQRRGTHATALDGKPLWILFENKFLVRNQIINCKN